MIDINHMSPEQLEKLHKYNNFYSESLLESFGKMNVEKKDKIKNEPYNIAYNNIVNRTAEMIRYLGLNDPFSISIIFEYLLWNGYFSKDHLLFYSIQNRINEIAITGADIMRGKSVCLNNADMLTDILNATGIKAYTFGCNVKNGEAEKNKLAYKPDIERKIINPRFRDKFVSKIIGGTILRNVGNHAITLFKQEGNYLFCDPTSLGFLSFNDFLKAKYIGCNLEVTLKPWLPILLDKMTKEELDRIIYTGFVLSDKKTITIENISKLSELVIKLCNQSKPLFESFHTSCEQDIDIVCKTLKRN